MRKVVLDGRGVPATPDTESVLEESRTSLSILTSDKIATSLDVIMEKEAIRMIIE